MNPSRPAAFFGLTLLLMLPFYLLGAVGPDLTRVLPVPLPISALMFVCPALTALWLTRRFQGKRGVKALLGRVFDGQRIPSPGCWLASLLLMPLMLWLAFLLQRGLGQEVPSGPIPWLSLPLAFGLFFVGAVGEELGWTGYATDPLRAKWGSLRGALLLGSFWALIHVIPYLQAHRPAEWMVWQCLGTVALRVLMVWLYHHAGNSVLSAILFHAMLNVSEFFFPVYGSHYDPQVSAVVFIIFAALLWRWRSGESQRHSS